MQPDSYKKRAIDVRRLARAELIEICKARLARRSAIAGVDGMSVAVPGRREANGQLRRPLRADILMAAAGPAASLLLTLLLLVALLFGLVHPTLTDWVIGAALLSAFLALLNLVPIPGLDGGHLMVLTAARLGWQLPPQQEVRLHRQGLNALVALSLVPLLIQLWWMW